MLDGEVPVVLSNIGYRGFEMCYGHSKYAGLGNSLSRWHLWFGDPKM